MRDPLHMLSMKVKLTLTFAVVGFLAFGVGGYLVARSARAALEREIVFRVGSQSAAETARLARGLGQLVQRVQDFASDGYIRAQTARLGDPGSADGPRPDPAALIAHLRTNKLPLEPALFDLVILDLQGHRLAGVRKPDRVPDLSTLAPRLGRLGSQVGDLARPRAPGGAPLFPIATPVLALDRAEQVGTLVAWVQLGHWLVGLRDRGREGTSWRNRNGLRLVLRDRRRNTIEVPWWFRAGGPSRAEVIEGDDSLGLSVIEPGGGGPVQQTGSPPGTRRVFGQWTPLGVAGWTVLVQTDASEALAPVTNLQSRFVAIAVGVALALGVLFFFPLRYLVQPLALLETAARRMARGETRARIKVDTRDEIGTLAAAFNQMAEAVEERTGRLEHLAGDLSQRKEQLQAERDRLQLVIHSMLDGLILLDGEGRVRLANATAAPIVRAMESGDVPIAERLCGAGVPHGRDAGCAGCLGTPGGPARACTIEVGAQVFEVRSAPVPSAAGEYAGRVVIVRDVTARLELETRQMHQERLAVMGEVAAVVAHELNNPLASIRMFAQLMESELETGSPFREHVEVIARNTETCRRTIRGLLEYASAAAPEVGVFDLREVLRDAERFLRPVSRREGVTLVLDLPSGPTELWGDEIQVRQLFVNLLINAIQAAADGGRVEVRCRAVKAGAKLRVEVIDDGPGIPEPLRARVFETFFTTKKPGSGTGLGLAISRRIAEAHGGSLALMHAEPGRTVFRVVLSWQPARSGGTGSGSSPRPAGGGLARALVLRDAPELDHASSTIRSSVATDARSTDVSTGASR